LLPAAAVALIALFTVSLALAEPQGDSRQIMAARSDSTATIATADDGRMVTNDAITENEAALFSSPLPWPQYHDRYRFYHRYDRYKGRSRLNTFDDGVN
jgi:hypothetical protein